MTRMTWMAALACVCLAAPAQAGGDLWFSTANLDGYLEIYGCVPDGSEADNYSFYIGLGSCTGGGCPTFDSGEYNDAGPPFVIHDHDIEVQTINGQQYIAGHGVMPTTGTGEAGAWLLATIKLDPLDMNVRDVYFRNPATGKHSDFKLGTTRRNASQHSGDTEVGTPELESETVCGIPWADLEFPMHTVRWFMDPCGRVYAMWQPEWQGSCCDGNNFGSGYTDQDCCDSPTPCPVCDRIWYKTEPKCAPNHWHGKYVTPICGTHREWGTNYCGCTQNPVQPIACVVNATEWNNLESKCRVITVGNMCIGDQTSICPLCEPAIDNENPGAGEYSCWNNFPDACPNGGADGGYEVRIL